jgi:hypothetical protein
MNTALIEKIANAVLYEGYMLYPYRHSSVKNQQRWNFGVVYPRAYSEMQNGIDPWQMTTECLVRGDAAATIEIKVRFLQAIARQMAKPAGGGSEAEPPFEFVASLQVGEKLMQSWQEAIERDVTLEPMPLAELAAIPSNDTFAIAGGREVEAVRHDGEIVGYIVRTRETLAGSICVRATKCGDGFFRVSVVISNLTVAAKSDIGARELVLLKSLLSAHTILGVTGGEFISLIDPSTEFQAAAADCKNAGTWPVLVGEEGARDAMLSSPIILYDYPQIAPESPGDLFDGTEIDEILALRILTLSDQEKEEIRGADDRSRQVLERTESLPAEHFMKLHGVLRGIKPSDEVGEGSREDRR